MIHFLTYIFVHFVIFAYLCINIFEHKENGKVYKCCKEILRHSKQV